MLTTPKPDKSHVDCFLRREKDEVPETPIASVSGLKPP